MTKPRILLTTTSFQDTPGEHHKLLAETGWEVVTARGPLNEADTLALMGEFDGYICGDDLITAAVIEKALPRLKVISKYGIGVDKIDLKTATAKGIPVLFTPGVNHTTVAEHAFLLLLALERNFLFHTDSTRAGGWKRKTGFELLGKTMGIVGLGRIGTAAALRAKAFGFRVVFFDPHVPTGTHKALGIERAGTLAELLATSDTISIHCPLTAATRGMIGEREIAAMRPGAFLVNTARGDIVRKAPLFAALRAGHLGGAGLDVVEDEPLRTAEEAATPNLIVTCHAAFCSPEGMVEMRTTSARIARAAVLGEPVWNRVN